MEIYTGFSMVYDQLMDNVPYEDWCVYLTGLLRDYGCREGLVLELGCGTGDIWKTNLSELDKSITLKLTDFSENMVAAVKEAFAAYAQVSCDVVNIEAVSYADSSYDVAIANMMLYHVPDLHKGLSEVRRVLKADGCFYCATYGEYGIMPYIAGLLGDYGVTMKTRWLLRSWTICRIIWIRLPICQMLWQWKSAR